MPPTLDHLVYATPDLAQTLDDLERALGVRPSAGGQHLGRGTRNALLALSATSYLEIVGPDTTQPAPPTPRWFRIDELTAPRIVTWAAAHHDLPALRTRAAAAGLALGEPVAGSRVRPDRVTLQWTNTSPLTMTANGLIPFFIDWGASPHPAQSAAGGVSLLELRAEHPDPDAVEPLLQALDLPIGVTRGNAPALIALLDSPRGHVTLT